MALKDILVHLDASPRTDVRVKLAAGLARRHDARLIGLHVVDTFLPAVAGTDVGSGTIMGELLDRMRAEALAASVDIETAFREALSREDVAGEWRMAEGRSPTLVALHARYADLAVLGQADPAGGEPSATAMVEAVLFETGRPVLLVPHSGDFPTLGQRVLIGWNASAQSSRAVHDALPILERAGKVVVASINPRSGTDGHGEAPGSDIARHLARHGVATEVVHTSGAEIGAGDMLLNRAADLSADLLVVGAYGHSRLRETILGGVTRMLLRQMTVPVLMSH